MPKNARGRAASVRPCLRVSFGSAREFRRAYENCLARGEIEVETTENVRPRKVVDVELELTFCGESILFQGAVVSSARSGRGESSRPAKVTVQLLVHFGKQSMALTISAGTAATDGRHRG